MNTETNAFNKFWNILECPYKYLTTLSSLLSLSGSGGVSLEFCALCH